MSLPSTESSTRKSTRARGTRRSVSKRGGERQLRVREEAPPETRPPRESGPAIDRRDSPRRTTLSAEDSTSSISRSHEDADRRQAKKTVHLIAFSRREFTILLTHGGLEGSPRGGRLRSRRHREDVGVRGTAHEEARPPRASLPRAEERARRPRERSDARANPRWPSTRERNRRAGDGSPRGSPSRRSEPERTRRRRRYRPRSDRTGSGRSRRRRSCRRGRDRRTAPGFQIEVVAQAGKDHFAITDETARRAKSAMPSLMRRAAAW